jgi:hypothetical protein
VGLSAVNGAASTFMRSDAAPALSQAITPSWTGQHTFAYGGGAQLILNGSIEDASYQTLSTAGTPYGYLGSGAAVVSSTGGLALGGVDRLRLATGASASTTRLDITNSAISTSLPLRGASGSVSDPGFSFSADDNTGLYSVGADSLGITAGGTLRVTVDTNGTTFRTGDQAVFGGGSASAPPITFTGDTNTGVYAPAADTVSVTTGGSQRLQVANSETNVFTVIRGVDGAVGGPTYAFTNDGDSGLYSSAANQPAMATGGAVRMFWNSASTVSRVPYYAPDGSATAPAMAFESDPDTGVYTFAPDALGLALGGSLEYAFTGSYMQIQDGTVTTPGINFLGDTNTGIYRAGADDMRLVTNGADRVTINNSGVQVGAPTGGALGNGTINATGLYINGVPVSGGATSTGSFTGTLTGLTTSPTCNMEYRLTGTLVFLYNTANCNGTSNSNNFTMTGLPAAIQPTRAVTCLTVGQQDNGTALVGAADITAGSGTVTMLKQQVSGSNIITGASLWTASGTKGLTSVWTCIYDLDS